MAKRTLLIDLFTEEEKNLMKEYYNNGKTVNEISKIFNIHHSNIYNYFDRVNFKRRVPSVYIKKYSCNENYFDVIDTEDKAYFLGLLISDGYNMGTGFSISLQEEDKYILEKFKECISYTGCLKKYDQSKYNKNSKTQVKLRITSRKLSNALTKLGCIKKKSHFTYFPDISENFYSHFIRGIFDGDGWFTNINTSGTFGIIGNFDLINKIQMVLIKECNLTKTKLSQGKNMKNTNIFSVLYSGSQNLIKIRDWLYKDATIYLQRKYNKVSNLIKKEIHRKDCIICGKKYFCKDLCKRHYAVIQNKKTISKKKIKRKFLA